MTAEKRVKARPTEPGPYCFESDGDGHFYVIPVARMCDWSDWLESEDALLGDTPDWAYRVGGNPSLVCFPEYFHG